MGLVIVPALPWLLKITIQQPVSGVSLRIVITRKTFVLCLPLRMMPPGIILYLLLDESPKVNPLVKGVCFSPRIADPAFSI